MLSTRMYKCATSQTLLSLELKSSGTIDENQKKIQGGTRKKNQITMAAIVKVNELRK